MMRKVHAVTLLITMVLCVPTIGAKTYYVSTKGDDTADGGSEKAAWRTIAHAARVAQAGDTVLVAPGDYGDERVIFANSGKKGKPIVVKSSGGRPVLKSGDGKASAFLAEGKSHIHIEGFDVFGYNAAAILCRGSSYCRVRNFRCFGRGGSIRMTDGAHRCRVDSCYVEDTYRNSIFIYGDSCWGLRPSTWNTITNCTVVRGGHSSIDVHTCCPDSYVIGCLIRERGKERDGRRANCGLYLHNHLIDRLRAIGNSVCDVYWGLELAGANDSVIAENLFFNFVKADIDHVSLPHERVPVAYCTRNVIADNIMFNASKSTMRLCGAWKNVLRRNYVDGGPNIPNYQCYRVRGVDATGNVIADPMKGCETVNVHAGGDFTLSYSPGLWPVGTVFRLTGAKTVEKKMVPDGVSLGPLTPGTYTIQAILPGKALPAPQHLRVVPLPKAEGGTVIVWADCCSNETGFVLERKIPDEKNFKEIAKLKTDTTRYIDKQVGRKKAIYRVRAVRGEEKSPWSNTDEVVRYGYWFTDRTGLAVRGFWAFGQVETGCLKTLIVENVRRVERRAGAAEGLSSFALLEAGKPTAVWPKSAGAKGKSEVWLVASKPVTATLRWRAGWIRGFVQRKGDYRLELTTAGQTVKSAAFNGKTVKTEVDKKTGCVRLDLSGSGVLEIELTKR